MEQVSRARASVTPVVEGHRGQGHIAVPAAMGSALMRNKSICW